MLVFLSIAKPIVMAALSEKVMETGSMRIEPWATWESEKQMGAIERFEGNHWGNTQRMMGILRFINGLEDYDKST